MNYNYLPYHIKEIDESVQTFVWKPSDQDVSYDGTHPWAKDRGDPYVDILHVTNHDGEELKVCLKIDMLDSTSSGQLLFDTQLKIHQTLKNPRANVDKWYLIAIRGTIYATLDEGEHKQIFIRTQSIYFTRYDKAVEKYGFKSEDPITQVKEIHEKRRKHYLAGFIGDFACPSCPKRYEKEEPRDKHITIRHGEYKCDMCAHDMVTFTQNTEEDMLLHMKKHHPLKYLLDAL